MPNQRACAENLLRIGDEGELRAREDPRRRGTTRPTCSVEFSPLGARDRAGPVGLEDDWFARDAVACGVSTRNVCFPTGVRVDGVRSGSDMAGPVRLVASHILPGPPGLDERAQAHQRVRLVERQQALERRAIRLRLPGEVRLVGRCVVPHVEQVLR